MAVKGKKEEERLNMSVGKMSVGKTSVGKMSLGETSVGKVRGQNELKENRGALGF